MSGNVINKRILSGGNGVKRATILVLVLLMLLVQAVFSDFSAAYADDENGVVMRVQMGFEGRFRLGNWTPITVEVENSGGDLQGDLEMEVYQPNGVTSAVFSTPAVIPHGTRKRFKLYARINTVQRDFEVRLTQGRTVIDSVKVDDAVPVTRDSYLLGLVTDDKEGLSYWKASLGSNRIFYQYEAVYLGVEDFPDRKEVLDNFMILILNNADTAGLSKQQLNVLRQWVESGGILIVGTGANGYKTLSGLLDGILSAAVSDTRQVAEIPVLESIGESTFRSNAPFEVLDLTIDDAKPVVEHEGKGLVWKISRGEGYIFVSAFDLGLEPFMSWTGNKMLWENILNLQLDADRVSILKDIEARKAYGLRVGTSTGQRIREALGVGMKTMDLPSFTKLLLVLAAYLLIVGPVNYLVLKRLDRREWTWFTIPITVMIFSSIIYGLGYMAKGSDVITHALSVVNLDKSGRANVESHIGVFVPKKGDYRVTIEGAPLLTLGSEEVYYDYGAASGSNRNDYSGRPIEARVVQGRRSSITFYNTSVWTMQDLVMEDTVDEFGMIDADLHFEGDRIKGSITNNTPYPLQDVLVYTMYGYQVLGNLAAGEVKQVDVPVFAKDTQLKSQALHFYTMLDQVFPYPHTWSTGHGNLDDEVRKKYMQRLIVEGLVIMDYNHTATLPLKGTLNLIGFSTQRIVPDIEVNGAVPQTMYHTNAITMHLDVPYEKDKNVYIPPGVVMAVLEREKSQGIAYTEGNTVAYLNGGEGAFYFNLKPYEDLEYSKLEIYVNYQGVVPELYVYHPEKGEYVNAGDGLSIDNSQGLISIDGQAVQEYITPQGRLELKVKVVNNPANPDSQYKPDTQGTIQLPTLSIEGRRR